LSEADDILIGESVFLESSEVGKVAPSRQSKTVGSAGRSMLSIALVGGVMAGVVAFLSVKFLMRYFEFGRLDPFGYYCAAMGAASLILLSLH